MLREPELLALWNIVFPMHRGVWFDEDEELIHYNLEAVDRWSSGLTT